jgi:hypothetical protein
VEDRDFPREYAGQLHIDAEDRDHARRGAAAGPPGTPLAAMKRQVSWDLG